MLMSHHIAKAAMKRLIPPGCSMFILGIILIVVAVFMWIAQEWGVFTFCLILGIIFILIWPIFL